MIKNLKNKLKAIEEQKKKKVEALKVLEPITHKLRIEDSIPENALTEEANNKLLFLIKFLLKNE